MRPSVGVVAACLAFSGTAMAQGRAAPRSPWAGSAAVGAVQVSDTTSLDAIGGVIEYRPLAWLTLGAAPSVARRTSGAVTTSGVGDLPLTAGAATELGAPWGPELAAAVTLTLATGNAACGLGGGATSVAMDVGAGVSPAERAHLSVDASHNFSGLALSSLDAPGSTWLDVDADWDVTSRLVLSTSLGGDFGGTDTLAAGREVGAGARYALRGPLSVSVGVTHRVAGAAPTWGLALTLGTAGGGLSPLNPSSPLARQRRVFAGGAGARGHAKIGACP